MSYWNKILVLLLIILVFGCAPKKTETGIIARTTAPAINTTPEPVVIKNPDIIISTANITFINDTYFDIMNCGDKAYGYEVADRALGLMFNFKLRYLIITNTTPNLIGGCPDIIKLLPKLQHIYIYGPVTTTPEYNDLMKWIPSEKTTRVIT